MHIYISTLYLCISIFAHYPLKGHTHYVRYLLNKSGVFDLPKCKPNIKQHEKSSILIKRVILATPAPSTDLQDTIAFSFLNRLFLVGGKFKVR